MKNSKQVYLLFFMVLLASLNACKPDMLVHELKGETRPVWFEPIPYGMAYIKQGTLRLGASEEKLDQPLTPVRTVSIRSFWMDETEITNNEYRQYINWVCDSVAASLTFQAGIEYYKATAKNNQPIEPAQVDRTKIKQIWKDERDEVQEALKPIFYQGKEQFYGNSEIDYRKVFYRYDYIDLKKAAMRSNSYNYQSQSYNGGISGRQDFVVTKMINVYPDTLVWVRDFTYSYNEPWTLKYFFHPAFREYPVVGITWEQANAFCHWRTKEKSRQLANADMPIVHDYRLPTEAEWEYAARGGRLDARYPWGGYYTSSQKGCYQANFKPKRGNYVADSRYSTKTMKVGSFDPNDFGLFDMAGNVAEWTSTAFDISGYEMIYDMNPEYQYNAQAGDPPALKRKVVRGGSWKDVSYYIQVSTRDFEYQDSANSFVGFRCIMNAIEDELKRYE